MEVNGRLKTPGGKNTRRPLNRRVVGPQIQPVWPLGEEKNHSPLLAIEPRFFGCSFSSRVQSLSTDIWRLQSRVMKKNSIACQKPYCLISVLFRSSCFSDFLRFVLFVFCSTVLQRCLPQLSLSYTRRT
jgi:hypothetical protein